MKKVQVLMSTYNGEKYLREQIDSILAQKGVEVHLLVRIQPFFRSHFYDNKHTFLPHTQLHNNKNTDCIYDYVY